MMKMKSSLIERLVCACIVISVLFAVFQTTSARSISAVPSPRSLNYPYFDDWSVYQHHSPTHNRNHHHHQQRQQSRLSHDSDSTVPATTPAATEVSEKQPQKRQRIFKRRLVVRVPFASAPDPTQLNRLYRTLFGNKEKKQVVSLQDLL